MRARIRGSAPRPACGRHDGVDMGLMDRLRQRITRQSAQETRTGAEAPATVGRRESTAPRHERPDSSTFAHTGPRFAVIDVETTGLSATTHRVLEIAVVTTDASGTVLEAWSTRLNPEGPVGATHIHGITDRDVAHAPLFRDVVPELNVRFAGAALCAHNARFDLAFLRAEYARAGWRMPFVPSLCTLEASTYHLPGLPRRRLGDVCQATGVHQGRAHSALHDATAAAGLLAAFLHPGRPPRGIDIGLPAQGHAVAWPVASEGAPLPLSAGRVGGRLSDQARRVMSAAAASTPPKPLVQLISRFSLVDALREGAPEGTVAYLEKLAEALEDGVLEPAEAAALADVADSYELSDRDVASAHRAFASALAREAVADGKVTRAEREELGAVAAALGVPAAAVGRILKEAAQDHHSRLGSGLGALPEGWDLGDPLRVGDRVVFTGCDSDQRARLESASAAAGVRVMNGVAGTTAVLVTDGSMDGTKARKAAELGTRTVTPATYERLLAHLQPAAVPAEAARPPSTSVLTPAGTGVSLAPIARKFARRAETGDPTPSQLRAWGRDNGWTLGERGRLPAELLDAYRAEHPKQ